MNKKSEEQSTWPEGAIMVIGRYGMVGRRICMKLGERYPGQVFVVGRSLKKANEFAAKSNGAV